MIDVTVLVVVECHRTVDLHATHDRRQAVEAADECCLLIVDLDINLDAANRLHDAVSLLADRQQTYR